MHGFVGQSSRARNDSDRAFFVNARGHDAQLAFARRNNSRAVRPNQPRPPRLQKLPSPHHIQRRNALGDAHDQIDVRVGGFHDGVCCTRRRHEDNGRVRARLLHRLMHGVEYRPTFVNGTALAGRDSAHNVSSIFRTSLGVERSFAPGQALHNHPRFFVD